MLTKKQRNMIRQRWDALTETTPDLRAHALDPDYQPDSIVLAAPRLLNALDEMELDKMERDLDDIQRDD
jgi:hypothetical protein